MGLENKIFNGQRFAGAVVANGPRDNEHLVGWINEAMDNRVRISTYR